MIEILIFAPNLNGGGAERVLVNYLSNLDYHKFSVTLVLAERKGVFLNLVPEEVNVISLNKRKTVFCFNKLRKLIIKLKPDIVYSTLIRTHIVLTLSLLALVTKPRLILRSPNSPKLLKEHKMLNFVQDRLLNYCYRRADFVIAQTPEMKPELIKYHRVDAKKIKVVMNPLDKVNIDVLSKVGEAPFDFNKINVVAAGRIIKQKGFDVLIESFNLVLKKNKKFHLHILGEDVVGELSQLKERAKELEIEQHITFHGFQENPYIFYKHADLFVLSSRWEGLPNTVLENLYMNKPIIATRCIPSLNALISNGVNGWLVDVENVEELAIAILDYNLIKMKNNSSLLGLTDINQLFLMDTY